jgi:hypothetical protein
MDLSIFYNLDPYCTITSCAMGGEGFSTCKYDSSAWAAGVTPKYSAVMKGVTNQIEFSLITNSPKTSNTGDEGCLACKSPSGTTVFGWFWLRVDALDCTNFVTNTASLQTGYSYDLDPGNTAIVIPSTSGLYTTTDTKCVPAITITPTT